MSAPRTCLPGDVFGRWTVLREGDSLPSRRKVWCRCECGVKRQVKASALPSGESRSCGCLQAEVAAAQAATLRLTHGASRDGKRTPEFRTWLGMLDRCYSPKNKCFAIYGGRGITVCQRWRESFAAFLADMGPRPEPSHSIDRKDGNGNYEPSNCRWATKAEQSNNTSRNYFLEIDGERHTVAEWSSRSGIQAGTILARVSRYGWEPRRAVFQAPVSVDEACRRASLKRHAEAR